MQKKLKNNWNPGVRLPMNTNITENIILKFNCGEGFFLPGVKGILYTMLILR